MVNLKRFFQLSTERYNLLYLLFLIFVVFSAREFAVHYGAEQIGYYENDNAAKEEFARKMATRKYRILSLEKTDADAPTLGDKFEYTLIKVRP